MDFFYKLSLSLVLTLCIAGQLLAQQRLYLNEQPTNRTKWTMIGANMIEIQDFDLTNSNPVDSMCCGQKPSYLDRSTVTIGFGLYRNLNSRWALNGDLGVSYGSIRSKTPLTSDGWKTWSQSARAEINYHLSDKGRLQPYIFSGVNGIMRKGAAYGTIPVGIGARFVSPHKEFMIASQLGYGLGLVHNLNNSVVFSLKVYVNMGSLRRKRRETPPVDLAPKVITLRDTIVKRDTVWLEKEPPPYVPPEPASEQPAPVSDTMKLAIYFDFDSYSLSKSSFEVLNAVVPHLKLNTKTQCLLYGYTDLEGPAGYNQQLSESRVNTAKNYLISYGIQPNRILTRSFGKDKTVIPGDGKYLAWKNRRVEIFLIK